MAETLATYSLPEEHVKMYTANVRAALNRKGGILTGLINSSSYSGEKVQLVNFIGPIQFTERKTVYADTKVVELEHTQRWISGTEYDTAVFIDRLDTLKMIYDPTSPYVERIREAAARQMDNIIMSKFFDTAKSGKDGSTLISFPSQDTVVHASLPMGLAKLRSLRKMMKKRLLDLRAMQPYIAVTADEVDDLFGETTTNSRDYNALMPLMQGEIAGFFGFNFVPFETYLGTGIPNHTDTGHLINDCPAWVMDGMAAGTWEGLVITINNRPDKNNIKQIHATFTYGATRLEEGKVFQVQCQRT